MNQGRSIREDISTQSKMFHRSLEGIESRLRAVELHLEYGQQTRGTCSNGYTDTASNYVEDALKEGKTEVEYEQEDRYCADLHEMSIMDSSGYPSVQRHSDVMSGIVDASNHLSTERKESFEYIDRKADVENVRTEWEHVTYNDNIPVMENTELVQHNDCFDDCVETNYDGITLADSIANNMSGEAVEEHECESNAEDPGDVDVQSKFESVALLKDLFWWLIDADESVTTIEPFSCLLCGGKLQHQQDQLRTHEEGKPHKVAFVECCDYSKLERFVAYEKPSMARELGIKSENIFILTSDLAVVDPAIETAVRKTSCWYISFQSYEAKVVELTAFSKEICICFQRNIFTCDPSNVNLMLIKHIFEYDEAEKVGKDLFMLAVFLYNNYNIISHKCYNIHEVDLFERPVAPIGNTAIAMVSNALSVLCILPDTPAFQLKEGPLDVSKTNSIILQSLCGYGMQMDDERYEFNQGHWRCYYKKLE